MDSATISPTIEQIANLVVEKLTASGKLSDLANANLLTIEEETIDQVDAVTRAVISQILAKQSEAVDEVKNCPKCGSQMTPKKPQGRTLQSRRGKVSFKTDVSHCEACRLDFFPSDANTAV